MDRPPQRIAAVEAGGTKFRAAVLDAGHLNDAVAAAAKGHASVVPTAASVVANEIRVDTTNPAATLGAVGDFLASHHSDTPIDALGIASFGPLIVDAAAANYGTMASTPKPGWTGAAILTELQRRLGVVADIQTDVEAAAVAEHRLGAGLGHDSVAYVTVGTGIGVGVVNNGQIFRGRDHLELGHIAVDSDSFAGTCPFHGDCLEGRASGPAIAERTGVAAHELAHDHPIWVTVADELAQLACTITWAFSPDRILFSGGVGANAHLLPLLRVATARRLGGYSVSHADNDQLINTAGLGNDAGLIGAALLAADLLAPLPQPAG